MPCALVTGTSSGLGCGVALRLVELGWDVIGTMRRPPDPGSVPWEVAIADVTNDGDVEALGNLIAQRWGRLDALINNAGVLLLGPFEEMTSAEFRYQLEVNLVAPMAMARVCLPWLRETRGVIVQMSSIAGQVGESLFGAYNASKFGLEGASEALAEEVAPDGVRVVLVEPGPFRTEITNRGPLVAARDTNGRYAAMWRETDDWRTWFAADSADASACIDAIVAAATRDEAPFRIPVGKGIVEAVREHASGVVADANAAEAYLRPQ
jgi:NAD(P)-dependent dehydrogenase (short-subunit alcohol dehydrogenase family)